MANKVDLNNTDLFCVNESNYRKAIKKFKKNNIYIVCSSCDYVFRIIGEKNVP